MCGDDNGGPARPLTLGTLADLGPTGYYVQKFTKSQSPPTMSLLSGTSEAVAVSRPTEKRGLLALYLELTKARLSALVVLTTAVGYVVAVPVGTAIDWPRFVATVVGTALAAACASALNQIVEARRDGLMERTRGRPVPSGSLSATHGLVFSLAIGYAGLLFLMLAVNVAAAMLALLTILVYILIYTPLKTRSAMNTLVGAVCGAIPPMIGWIAATGRLDAGAWVLAGVLFTWQLPHFFSLAWRYRDDYARGGFAMLSVRDKSGRLTGLVAITASAALVPIALGATWWGVTGWVYAVGSVILGAMLVFLAGALCLRRSDARARRLFLATLVYLPLLLCLMVIDRAPAVGDNHTTVAPPAPETLVGLTPK